MMETSKQVLYLYSNPNTLRSCLAHGSLVCDAALGKHAHEKTLGNLTQCALFLTHLKLKPELMKQGLPEGSYLYPVVLEIRVLGAADFALPARLLGKDGQAVTGDLKAYDPKQHLGAFLAGELPLSMVESFLFLSEEDKGNLYDPSPNLWFPEALFRAMDDKERKRFKESLDFDLVREQGVRLDESMRANYPEDDFIKEVVLREKHRAIALCLALSAVTPLGENKANLDSLTAGLFMPKGEQLKVKGKPLPLAEMRLTDVDLDAVIGQKAAGGTDSARLNRRVLRKVYLALLGKARGVWPDAQALWSEVLALALAADIPDLSRDEGQRLREALLLAEKFFKGADDVPLRDVMAGIPRSLPALSGLVIVLKNRDETRISYFEEELFRFKLSPAASRYAWTYYAAITGLNPLNGAWKGNLWLNRFCDAYAIYKSSHKELVDGVYTFEQYKVMIGKKLGKTLTPGNPAGYPLEIKPLVDSEDLRRRLLAALNSQSECALVFKTLQTKFKTFAKSYTGLEYQVEARHQLKPEVEGETLLRFSSEPKKVDVFNKMAFAREWLADQKAFAGKMRLAGGRKVLMSLYAILTEEDA